MVMSTVEVRPHNVALATHDRTSISPPRSSQPNSDLSRPQALAHQYTPASYSVSGMMLTQGQQNATSVQIATRSIR